MKKFILCGSNAITDEFLIERLYELIEDKKPFKVIKGSDLSTSEDDCCYAYLFFRVMHEGELVEIVDEDVIDESGTVNGFDFATQQFIEIPPELL